MASTCERGLGKCRCVNKIGLQSEAIAAWNDEKKENLLNEISCEKNDVLRDDWKPSQIEAGKRTHFCCRSLVAIDFTMWVSKNGEKTFEIIIQDIYSDISNNTDCPTKTATDCPLGHQKNNMIIPSSIDTEQIFLFFSNYSHWQIAHIDQSVTVRLLLTIFCAPSAVKIQHI